MTDENINPVMESENTETTQPVESVETQEQESFIPDDYKSCGWAQNIKDTQTLWKTLANAQGLIGKKSLIPDLNACEDSELESYYSKVRPQEKTDYELSEDYSDEEKETLQTLLHTNGLSKKQAKNIIDGFQSLVNKDLSVEYGEDGLNKIMTAEYGEDWKNKTSNITGILKTALTPEQQQELNDKVPNKAIAYMYKVIEAVAKKYSATEKDFTQSSENDRGAKMSYADFLSRVEQANNSGDFETKRNLIKQYYG